MRLAITRQKIAPWVAAAFCAVLSLITILQNLWLTVVNRTETGGWAVVFLCFLPVCFCFVGMAISESQREIRELKQQLAELQIHRP
jgi:TRAP-type C4-dicarboxylate transport system permease small subunit